MVDISKEIQKLFLDPRTDSVDGLVSEIYEAHTQILAITDTSKGTLAPSPTLKSEAISQCRIPQKGIESDAMPRLIAGLFHGVPRWHSPHTMYNVAPPPLLPTVVGKLFTTLYNPNLVMDTASGESLITEQKVISAIAHYIDWNTDVAGGSFTFGGKATTIYGLKVGLKNVAPNSSTAGVKEDVVVFSTNGGHPSHISDAEWIGIGTNNVSRLKTDADGRIDLGALEEAIISCDSEGKRIAAIIISGGSTNNMVVDPIKKVVNLRNRLAKDLGLDYSPHIHVDAVVGFPWIFFKDYDFTQNSLNIADAAILRIRRVIEDLKDLGDADSFGIDFHKMGFCPYVSSLFMIKDKRLFSGSSDPAKSPFTYTIENSRPGDGPNSAYIALNTLGEEGFQTIIAHLTETAIDLQNKIELDGSFEVVNKDALGASVMFAPKLQANNIPQNELDNIAMRNKYTLRFIDRLNASGNPYYLDKVPGKSTGANQYPYISLKSYIMSPYANSATNTDFVSYMVNLKKEIDKDIGFLYTDNLDQESEFTHPLK